MQKLLVDLWKEQESTVVIVTHSMEEAIYLGDRVFRMGTKPGRLIEQLSVPRPDMSPEDMRKFTWFSETTKELLRRIEEDLPPCGPLPCPCGALPCLTDCE
jgi:NitT/TauT family transport system ATP-binding protein